MVAMDDALGNVGGGGGGMIRLVISGIGIIAAGSVCCCCGVNELMLLLFGKLDIRCCPIPTLLLFTVDMPDIDP